MTHDDELDAMPQPKQIVVWCQCDYMLYIIEGVLYDNEHVINFCPNCLCELHVSSDGQRLEKI